MKRPAPPTAIGIGVFDVALDILLVAPVVRDRRGALDVRVLVAGSGSISVTGRGDAAVHHRASEAAARSKWQMETRRSRTSMSPTIRAGSRSSMRSDVLIGRDDTRRPNRSGSDSSCSGRRSRRLALLNSVASSSPRGRRAVRSAQRCDECGGSRARCSWFRSSPPSLPGFSTAPSTVTAVHVMPNVAGGLVDDAGGRLGLLALAEVFRHGADLRELERSTI